MNLSTFQSAMFLISVAGAIGATDPGIRIMWLVSAVTWAVSMLLRDKK